MSDPDLKTCPKCQAEMPPEAAFCMKCGTVLSEPEKKPRSLKKHGNGQGTAYKRGKTYEARVVIGWKSITDEKGTRAIPCYRTKGGFRTKKEAKEACAVLLSSPVQTTRRISFATLFDEWKASYEERIKHCTMLCYTSAFRYFAPIHPVQFTAIKAIDLQHCIDACDKGKRTKENMKALASLLYKYARQQELVTENKAEVLYTGNDPKSTRLAFTSEQLRLLWQSDDIYAPYVLCMCYLGFRPNEMLTLKKTAYNPESGTLIGGFKTKAGTNRPIPVSPKIIPFIRARLEAPNTDYLFPRLDGEKYGQMMRDDYFREKCFDPLMEKLGIEGCVPYSCRHTFANLLKNVRGSSTDKAALMGHADTSMTEYYQEADLESLIEIINRI